MESERSLADKIKDPRWGAETLRSVSLFDELRQTELEDLYRCGNIKLVRTGNHVVIEGEPTRGLYILLSGKVSVYKTDKETGKLHRLAYLEAGEAFGELSLFDDSPRSATVSTESSCYLFFLEAREFSKYLNTNGDSVKARFFHRCAVELVEKVRKQNNDYIASQILLWKHALRPPNKEVS